MWWERQESNLRHLACEASALPLSYAPIGAEEPNAYHNPLSNKATRLPCEGSALPLS